MNDMKLKELFSKPKLSGEFIKEKIKEWQSLEAYEEFEANKIVDGINECLVNTHPKRLLLSVLLKALNRTKATLRL